MNTFKKIASVFAAAAMALSLAACSNSNGSSAVSDSTDDSSAASGSYRTVDQIKESGEITIGVFSDKNPFGYVDNDGKFQGYDVYFADRIAKDLGVELKLVPVEAASRVEFLETAKVDIILANFTVTDERKESGWMFSDGYYTATQCMAVAENSDIKGFEDLKDKQVAVKTGTQGASYAESLKDEYGFTLNYFEDSPTMYQAVAGGQAVACFEDTPIMAASIKDGGLGLKIVEGTENEGADYGFAVFNSDEQELLDMFNAGLANIKANGKYDEIIAKYLG